MKELKDFISKFTKEKFDIIEIKKRFFIASKEQIEMMEKIKEKEGIVPESMGVFLGEITKKKFKPSLALLDLLAKHSDRKIFVDDKAEWLFLCKKDVFNESVTKCDVKTGLVLVQNKNDENLGYGKIVRKGKVFVQNLMDRGDFLRRER
jgi:ribosome biogenesis protein Nip4